MTKVVILRDSAKNGQLCLFCSIPSRMALIHTRDGPVFPGYPRPAGRIWLSRGSRKRAKCDSIRLCMQELCKNAKVTKVVIYRRLLRAREEQGRISQESGFLHFIPVQACIWLRTTWRYPINHPFCSSRARVTRRILPRNGDHSGQSYRARGGYPGLGAVLSPEVLFLLVTDRTAGSP